MTIIKDTMGDNFPTLINQSRFSGSITNSKQNLKRKKKIYTRLHDNEIVEHSRERRDDREDRLCTRNCN